MVAAAAAAWRGSRPAGSRSTGAGPATPSRRWRRSARTPARSGRTATRGLPAGRRRPGGQPAHLGAGGRAAPSGDPGGGVPASQPAAAGIPRAGRWCRCPAGRSTCRARGAGAAGRGAVGGRTGARGGHPLHSPPRSVRCRQMTASSVDTAELPGSVRRSSVPALGSSTLPRAVPSGGRPPADLALSPAAVALPVDPIAAGRRRCYPGRLELRAERRLARRQRRREALLGLGGAGHGPPGGTMAVWTWSVEPPVSGPAGVVRSEGIGGAGDGAGPAGTLGWEAAIRCPRRPASAAGRPTRSWARTPWCWPWASCSAWSTPSW